MIIIEIIDGNIKTPPNSLNGTWPAKTYWAAHRFLVKNGFVKDDEIGNTEFYRSVSYNPGSKAKLFMDGSL